ncbi:MAG: primosomal protein N' [Planctomycetes bacterium]|nr:primosomal protein N' [Planctomycetota bacterium]
MARGQTPTLFDLEPLPAAAAPPVRRTGCFARVALNRPVPREFTYAVSPGLLAHAVPGARVAVPFGNRRSVGVIVELEHETEIPAARLKDVLDVLDDEPVVEGELLGLTRWIALRYACSWGEALAAVLPAPLKREGQRRKVPRIRAKAGLGAAELEELRAKHPEQLRLLRTLLELGGSMLLRDLLRNLRLSESPARSLRKRGWVEIDYVEEKPDPLLSSSTAKKVRPESLSPAQASALERVSARLVAREHATFLLHGVTGSGKTEVYLRAIEQALAQGRGAIVLVPEIALTPQTVGWFRSRFGAVSVLHSRMSDGQRLEEWRTLQRGETRVVVGARSAIFAPVRDLGVIVVDEEHEPSFKQESVPRYHARDVAVERARRAGAVCLLGSATPALESWYAAQIGRYELLSLPLRVGGGAPCKIDVVDMKRDGEKTRGAPLFSRVLLHHLGEVLKRKEQAILFLNRRGFVPVLYCAGCQTTVVCGHCSTALTWHRRIQRLVCHTCCQERDLPRACPTCSRPGLRDVGVGSEKVEHDLARLLPAARIARMDSDTMRRREDYEETLGAFERHELDVLVGTQMIAKGLDFPRVTLVGILAADQALNLPDFRSEERTFQLLAQVAGRAGRAHLPGRVIVQTTEPLQAAIVHGARVDYASMARHLEKSRLEHSYPPFVRLCRVVFEDQELERCVATTQRFELSLKDRFDAAGLSVTEAHPAPLALVRGKHRQHLLLKFPLDGALLERVLPWLMEECQNETRTDVKIDVDPASLM